MDMDDASQLVGYCGIYCGDCFFHKGTVADLARDLRKELRAVRFDKTAESISRVPMFKAFEKYPECYDVLGNMVKMRCNKACKGGGSNPGCKVRLCCKKNGLEGCWECDDFETCQKLDFLKGGHGDAILKNLRNIRTKGMDEFLSGEKLWYSKPKE